MAGVAPASIAAVLLLLGLAVGCGSGSAADENAADGSTASAAAEMAGDAQGAATAGGDDQTTDAHAGHDHGADPGRQEGGSASGRDIDNGPVAKNFPDFEYLAQIPEAYRIAANYPDLLEQIPCYCPCELYGHPGLDGCYRSQHAAQCSTCLEEALVAGQLYEQEISQGGDPAAVKARVAAQVKQRYRSAIVRQALSEIPLAHTTGAQAYAQACSHCHQLPHPAMYTPEGWRQSLSRMQAYASQRDTGISSETWDAAVDYVRSISSRYPPEAGENYRAELKKAVELLQADEGDSAYYPGAQDPILESGWFERMVRAYRTAQNLPAEALAGLKCDCGNCEARGHDTVLACLNSGHGITCERAVERVEDLAARLQAN